ncbi:DUF2752 domain-containing protein [Marinactinospora thermotolerans]|uniref:DUF2752 domain-containing protein n=1 Tax=Marinactinospora thermotolerans DSM 45154 TaxID=1122192 RepID=A0A1T4KS58_9ACTN|nr:DUF2752 domain-containing protein [Marinactinospora thermotolerans]SJZ45167.1 Protein of unknown function [Marinactinospora thermotolerans DSM 45154]
MFLRAFERLRRRSHPAAAPLLVGVAGLAAATMVHFVDPNEPGHYPTCPWLMVTGTFCPGCGTMRCVHALTELDLVGALQMNVLTVALLPFLAVGYVRWLYRSFRPSQRPARVLHPFWLWVLLVAIVGFWILRNLPFAAFLAPG